MNRMNLSIAISVIFNPKTLVLYKGGVRSKSFFFFGNLEGKLQPSGAKINI